LRTDLFDLELPQERIALRPASPRDSAKLLVIRPGEAQELSDRSVGDLPQFLKAGDALVVNETKVIPARLIGERVREDARAKIEATLTKRESGDSWRALVKPLKRLQTGDRIRFGNEARVCMLGALDATVEEIGEGGEILLRFDFHGPVLEEAIDALGHMPLPPYIAARREDDDRDRDDYQTLFAKKEGSVAAPTAGLHFTNDLLAALDARGVSLHRVTLHVGPGTFLPVKTDDTDAHKMHAERGEVSKETAQALNKSRESGGRIIAVGSTALRLLESAANENGKLQAFSGETDIFITPGYKFKAADLMLTNFHLPRSTLFMLVAAFSGLERMKRAYTHAIANNYRFYSYGDACLLFPEHTR
jgi:S-adenosylmethionine:tRNA ribosyltransferase-isomerase